MGEVEGIFSSVTGLSVCGDALVIGLRLDKEQAEAMCPTCPGQLKFLGIALQHS